ncbi:MAG: N-acetylglucosamine-6-phosphate deacetylase, partial [Anaerolineae bacterium]|nr:N-acetylglucosamine-6-phosphate deacetylase [Anaerolineae bacterium]
SKIGRGTATMDTQKYGTALLVNGRIVLPDRVVIGRAVLLESGHIVDIVEAESVDKSVSRYDVGGRYVAPGLIDIHTHGAMGNEFNEGTEEAFEAITQEQVKHGVTGLLATTSSIPLTELLRSISVCREWMSTPRQGTRVLGVHLEGPYFSLSHRGAQNPENIRDPSDGTAAELLEHSDVLKIVTYAPELPGALDLTSQIVARGIVPAAGHSSATDEEVRAAIQVGLRHAVHLWSGQSTTIRVGPWRKPGLLEASLTYDELTGEIIADNRHLPATLMKLAYKCKGADRLCAVSDATSGAGLPEGTQLTTGNVECEVRDGVAILLDGSAFAGSTTLLGEMLPILVNVVGIPLPEAVRMMSLTPARIIGADDTMGSLRSGKCADITVLNEDLTVWSTIIAGRRVYEAQGPTL